MYASSSLHVGKKRIESKRNSRQRTVHVLSAHEASSAPSRVLFNNSPEYTSSCSKEVDAKGQVRFPSKKNTHYGSEQRENPPYSSSSSLNKQVKHSSNDWDALKGSSHHTSSSGSSCSTNQRKKRKRRKNKKCKDYVMSCEEKFPAESSGSAYNLPKQRPTEHHANRKRKREGREHYDYFDPKNSETLPYGVDRLTNGVTERHFHRRHHSSGRPQSESSYPASPCAVSVSSDYYGPRESRGSYPQELQDGSNLDMMEESLSQHKMEGGTSKKSSMYKREPLLNPDKQGRNRENPINLKTKRRRPEDTFKSSGKGSSMGCPTEKKMIQSPSPPLQSPKTIAHLRILLLAGLVCSETTRLNPKETSVPQHRLMLPCPIHSAQVALTLRHYFSRLPRVPYFAYCGLRSEFIAQELQCMALGFADPFCGPVSSLLELDVLSPDSVIVSNFDLRACDHVLRAVLRPDHPSKGASLWDPHKEEFPKWPLPLGAGLGVESRSLHLEKVQKFCVESPSRILHDQIVPSNEWLNTTSPLPQTNDATLPASLNSSPLKDEVKGHAVCASFPPGNVFMVGAHALVGCLVQRLSEPVSLYPAILPITQPSKKKQPIAPSGSNLPLYDNTSLEVLLNAPSAIEQHVMESGEELRQLLTVPTAKHSITTRAFQNLGGSRVQQICRHGTRHDCIEAAIKEYNRQGINHFREYPTKPCHLIHFRRILLPHTDVSLGDCSYLDTCRHTASCRFVHYEVDLDVGSDEQKSELIERCEANDVKKSAPHMIGTVFSGDIEQVPAQWILCDIRTFDFNILRNKIKIVMADPPWDIHMDLPYGTMTDAEMKALRLDLVQDEGCLFLWVTGRAMEVGRECMKVWGYNQVEELVWVKTNQLHRLIRTGRTGHWLNHSKEHCLVGIKGHPKLNHHLDTDIIVAEVRETSRKPDEIYRIIERLCPGPYKLELFGRPHNVRENWITLGNQLENVYLHDPEIINKYNDFATKACLAPFVPNATSSAAEPH